MKAQLNQAILSALKAFEAKQTIEPQIDFSSLIKIDGTKDPKHGEFSCNIALILAKRIGLKPLDLAQTLIQLMETIEGVHRVEAVAPGFINFFMDQSQLTESILKQVFDAKADYGRVCLGEGKRVHVELVSANPTGPLHVGHGRAAAFGASLASLLTYAGYEVTREYYVNDAGRQMKILALSLWLRYLSLIGKSVVFPVNGYQGDYVTQIAEMMVKGFGAQYKKSFSDLIEHVCPDEPEGGDKEAHIDELIRAAQNALGQAGFELFYKSALESIIGGIQHDLAEFGVYCDAWFSELGLFHSGALDKILEVLDGSGYTYEKEGAIWFKSTAFSDEKDRVLVRANGEPTYFASDIAYHWDKFNRGYDMVIDIFGADHHGYLPRLSAAIESLHCDTEKLKSFLVQFAILYRHGERVQMSTRSGSFVTLRALIDEVGRDAARFFYVMRKPEQHMDFDLDLAKSESKDNPVYYIQYAFARICSVFRQMEHRGLTFDFEQGLSHCQKLTTSHEKALCQQIGRYPEAITLAATAFEPHQIAYYLRELAALVHSYYNQTALICEDACLRMARLSLIHAASIVLENGLNLLGVSAPRSM